jgi:Tfp pilus assembly protein PilX
MSQRANNHGRERGSGLIVIIMIVAFMLAVGMLLLSVTGTSPKAADSMRLQGMAFDAAEAGFNAAWVILNDNFLNKVISSFNGQYRTSFGGAPGLDDPTSPNYFRGLTDAQLVADVAADNTAANPALYSSEPLASDPRCAFTVFLINDEAPGTIVIDDNDCILVCIGRGPRNTFKRLEIVIEVGS